ncbi:MAG: VTT domain-containing protein [Puniceicoccaceae bacterium]
MRNKREPLLLLVTFLSTAALAMAAEPGGGSMESIQAELLTMLGIALGTLVSEDLACISAGLLAASGQLAFASAVMASFLGIFLGDLLIYWLGFHFGRPLLEHRWARWFISRKAVLHAQHMFQRHGVWLILATRFIPGTRTATYFAAGALHAPFLRFLGVFAFAAALWTPLLVGLSFIIGRELLELYEVFEALVIPALLATGLLLYLIFHYGMPLLTWKGRRRLKGKWLRATRWEFWPWWQVYALVIPYILYLGFVRYRRPTLFTVVNPSMPHGGFLGESKSSILEGLSAAGEAIPKWRRIESGSEEERRQAFDRAMEELALDYPVVLKPDEGQRGDGVSIILNDTEAWDWLSKTAAPAILQAYVPGPEYGIFYVRFPSEVRGRVTSITIKDQLTVTGNGEDSIEDLIHAHPRAVALLDVFLARFDEELDTVLPEGKVFRLGQLGTHARGSLFLDGQHFITDALSARVEAIAQSYEGFYFGRFDIKVPDEASLLAGKNLSVIELNGLTSEETHIYDPRNSLRCATRTLRTQWRTAFAIAAENHDRGHVPPGCGAFLKDILSAWRRQRELD